ncbi:MAG: hypothetical protein IJ697_04360 [Synergistaceae bacterium]|nr:hypothetical protein [Synergistaceae bacterium]
MIRKFLCVIFVFLMFGSSEAAQQRRLSVVIFPTINSTELEIWESKYYPYNVLEQKMSDYLESLYKTSPMIEARVLDEAAMNRWLSGSRSGDDMAVQLELYSASMKDKHILGTTTSGRVLVRLRVFDRARVKEIAVRNVRGKSARFTLDSDEDIFWFDAAVAGLGIPFENGVDYFGLTKQKYKGQQMSRPTWAQFKDTAYWQSIKNAIAQAHRESLTQIRSVIRSNEPSAALMGRDNFSDTYRSIGRILAPTSTATRKKRDYIISLGKFADGSNDGVRVGEVLDVVRADTYVTVVPEEPVVVLPKVIGKVKVIKVYEDNAIVRVIRDTKKEPITLKDLVVKRTGITGR